MACLLRGGMLSGTAVSIDSARSFPILGLNMGQAASVEMRMLGKFHFSSVPHPEFAPLKQRISLSLNWKLARFIPNANAHVRKSLNWENEMSRKSSIFKKATRKNLL